jgi:hypothetical protein
MNRSDTAKVYALVCGAYDVTMSEIGITAWHALLADLDAKLTMEAARRLCLRDSSFPPRPGEVVAEMQRLTGDTPPPLEAATGYYLAGQLDAHPVVAQVAAGCYWDRINAPEEAKWDFRARYQAALHDIDEGTRRPVREALNGAPKGIGQLVRELGPTMQRNDR